MPAATNALSVLTAITTGVSFDIPVVDINSSIYQIPGDITSTLYAPVVRLQVSEITDGNVNGPGSFDVLMRGAKAHLQQEYEAGRITGDQYTKAYIAMIELAMTNATQFLLAREGSFWEGHRAQIGAITARAGLEEQRLRVSLTQIQTNTAKAEYAVTVFSLATAEVNHDTAVFNLANIMPKQADKLTAETAQTNAQTTLVCKQMENIMAQTLNEPKKGVLLDEKIEATRGQTIDTRRDGGVISGAMGKQKELYTQQITAYQRDSEIKAARIFSDAWITQKTIDEGLTAPTGFTNVSLDQVLTSVKLNNGLTGTAP